MAKVKINALCLRCRKRCKQFHYVKIVVCKQFIPVDD